jgi:hypothetical protein
MRIVPRAIARSVVLAGFGILSLVAPLSLESPAASAQGSSQITLDVDAPSAGATITNGQSLLVGGWAAASGAPGAGVVSVDVFLDGAPGTGVPLGRAQLGMPRDDVARATGHADWARSGYNFNWVPRDVSQGAHTIYVVARAVSGDTTTETVQVTGCGCGTALRGSFTNPIWRQVYPGVWEKDTGGPGVTIERDYSWPFWW